MLRRKMLLCSVLGLAVAALVSGAAFAATRATSEPSQLMSTSSEWTVEPSFTVGESIGDYTPVGVLDGIGNVFELDEDTIRVYVNHELTSAEGATYELANGVELTGARISQFDIDKDTLTVVDGGIAYDYIYDVNGDLVEEASQIGGGLDRFCSSRGVFAGQYGFVDDITFSGEETGNGVEYALDIANRNLWAVPALGRAAWENVTPLDSGNPNTVAIMVGDDTAPAPVYLYIGKKNAKGDGSFLDRNGLAVGQLYYLVLTRASTVHYSDPEDFNGTGSVAQGRWKAIKVFNSDGSPRTDTALRAEAFAGGGFAFARPEDVHDNPNNPTEVVIVDTGRGSLFPSDDWGTTYVIENKFRPDGKPSKARVTIVYDGDDAGNGQFPHPDYGLRSPDNLVWANDGYVYIQEDRATSINEFGGESGEEASFWKLDPSTGILERVGKVDRSAIPTGQIDDDPGDLGDWETSGVLDVTDLFDGAEGTVLIADVQAHSLGGPPIDDFDLVQGGQLVFLFQSGE